MSDVTPGSTVVMGSVIGRYLAKVVAWDFEVSDADPIVVLDLLPVTPKSVADALARSNPRLPDSHRPTGFSPLSSCPAS